VDTRFSRDGSSDVCSSDLMPRYWSAWAGCWTCIAKCWMPARLKSSRWAVSCASCARPAMASRPIRQASDAGGFAVAPTGSSVFCATPPPLAAVWRFYLGWISPVGWYAGVDAMGEFFEVNAAVIRVRWPALLDSLLQEDLTALQADTDLLQGLEATLRIAGIQLTS